MVSISAIQPARSGWERPCGRVPRLASARGSDSHGKHIGNCAFMSDEIDMSVGPRACVGSCGPERGRGSLLLSVGNLINLLNGRGFRLRFCVNRFLGRLVGLRGAAVARTFDGTRSGTFSGIIGDIPARSFELDGGCGQQAVGPRPALGTFFSRRSGGAFDSLETMSALDALVFVKWQRVTPFESATAKAAFSFARRAAARESVLALTRARRPIPAAVTHRSRSEAG